MQAIAQFFTDLGNLGMAEFGIILAVLVMDAALSADNAIAINALVKDLPPKIQNKAMWIGMLLAAVLRLIALVFAAFIIANPWVKILGAAYLIKLCVDHFRKMEADEAAGHTVRKSFVSVLVAIGFLDLSLSIDNVVAVVAMSQNLAVIVIGVLASIAMLAVATQVVRKVMRTYPSLEEAAYVILAFLGVTMLLENMSEFLLWMGEKITLWRDVIIKMHYDVGEVGHIMGVGAILAIAIIIDISAKRRKKAEHHKVTHGHSHAAAPSFTTHKVTGSAQP
jgi:YkoY family integral membrane protein